MKIFKAMLTWLSLPQPRDLLITLLVTLIPVTGMATEQPDSDDWDVPDEDELLIEEPASAKEPPAPLEPEKTVIAPNVDLKTVITKPKALEKTAPVFVPVDEISPSAVILPPQPGPAVPETPASESKPSTPVEPSQGVTPPKQDGQPTDATAQPQPPLQPLPTEVLPPADTGPAPNEAPTKSASAGQETTIEYPPSTHVLKPAMDKSAGSSIDLIKDTLKAEKPKKKKDNTFKILGAEVPPGTATRLAWTPSANISGLALPTPVLVINGLKEGPTLCLTAAIHGDELNGIEIVRRVMYEINPEKLKGRVIAVPIVNLQGFQRGSRYLPDRRDLNRYFPGVSRGSLASRIAHSLFRNVLSSCDSLIDVHTGSLRRINLPQVRADMRVPEVAKFTEGFDDMVVVHVGGGIGMLRWAFVKKGIPAVTLEMGESMRIDEYQIKAGVHGINGVLDKQGMYSRSFIWGDPEPIYYKSTWVRAETGGILFSDMDLDDNIKKGEQLGVVIDPITNETTPILSPIDGKLLGMAVDQVVMPGFAAYHIGRKTSEEQIVEPTAVLTGPPAPTTLTPAPINPLEKPQASASPGENSPPKPSLLLDEAGPSVYSNTGE